jgi:hypothetical protein
VVLIGREANFEAGSFELQMGVAIAQRKYVLFFLRVSNKGSARRMAWLYKRKKEMRGCIATIP